MANSASDASGSEYEIRKKRQSIEWEKIFANEATDKGIISKTTPAVQHQKVKQHNKKNGQKI